MPTLTPKPPPSNFNGSTTSSANKAILVDRLLRRLLPRNILATDHDESFSSTTTSYCQESTTLDISSGLMQQFESLQALLVILLVYHNLRAALFPCAAFGPSAAHVIDVSVCDDYHTVSDDIWNMLFLALPSPMFCLSALWMISGIRQGLIVWKASIDVLRKFILQRMAYLLLTGASVILLAGFLDIANHHQQRVAELTQSVWLLQRVSTTTHWAQWFNQMAMGLVHQSSVTQNNPSLLFLSLELIGTVIVSGLVLLLKGSPHRLRSRWMMVLFLAMLGPSVIRNQQMSIQVNYQILSGVTDAVTDTRTIGVDPIHHSHLLQRISANVNQNSQHHHDKYNTNSPLSALQFTFTERHQPDSWYNNHKDEKAKDRSLMLDDPYTSINTNGLFIDELWKASDPTVHSVSTPWIDGVVGVKWGTDAPWILWSSFVAGAWMSEALLAPSSSLRSVVLLGRSRPVITARSFHYLLLPMAAMICGSYPETDQRIATGPVWKFIRVLAGYVGMKGQHSYQLWGVVGSFCLMLTMCFFYQSSLFRYSEKMMGMYLPDWGQKMAFSLFLLHLPIFLSISCTEFVFFQQYTDDTFWSSILTILFSIPFYLCSAFLFHKLVEEPVQILSDRFSRYLLTDLPYHPDRGFSLKDPKSHKSVMNSA